MSNFTQMSQKEMDVKKKWMSQKDMDYRNKVLNCSNLKRNEKTKKLLISFLFTTFDNTLLADNPHVVLNRRLL